MNYDPRFHHRRSIRLRGYDYSRAGAYFITICTYHNNKRFGDIVPIKAGEPRPAERDVRHITLLESPDAAGSLFAAIRNPNKHDPYAIDACMELNECGQIAYNEWLRLPERFPNCELGVFQIMPDHMHGIIVLMDRHGDGGFAGASAWASARDARTVGASLADAPMDAAASRADAAASRADAAASRADAAASHADAAASRADAPASHADAPTAGDIVGAYKSLVFNGCLGIYKSRDARMGKLWHRNYYEHIIRSEESFHRIAKYIVSNPDKWMKKKIH